MTRPKRTMLFFQAVFFLFLGGGIITGGTLLYRKWAFVRELMQEPPVSHRAYHVRIITRHSLMLQGLEDSFVVEFPQRVDLYEFDTVKITHYGR